jgi:hypothetical protein
VGQTSAAFRSGTLFASRRVVTFDTGAPAHEH